jgi:tetraacyldisaccharide 4'-kinase
MCSAAMSSAIASARLRVAVSRGLEEGAWDGPVARLVARAWSAVGARSIARPLVWRDGLRVVAVGGATLGGSGKTPLAIACARALAEAAGGRTGRTRRAGRVAFVAHGYAAKPGEARVVECDDDVRAVGDEAIVAARALAGVAGAVVVVGPSRQGALDFAASLADTVVVDGVLQTAPRRATLSLLALDGQSPWGSGGVVPSGDLRASRSALLGACDATVTLRDEEALPRASVSDPTAHAASGASHSSASVRSRGAFVSGELVPWSSLASVRLGLFTALARPSRLLAALARRGVVPDRVLRVPDHGVPSSATATLDFDRSVQLWLASPKCAVHLEAAGVPHAAIEHEITLEAALRGTLQCV